MTKNFQIGQTQKTNAIEAFQARRNAHVAEVTSAFFTPKVNEYDYIWFVICGGAAMAQRTISTIYKTYPTIRGKMHTSVLDFATEADDKRGDFDILPLGQAVNGRLRDIVRRTDLPWDKLTPDQMATVQAFVRKYPDQTYDDGAGACPELGLVGIMAALDDTVEYFKTIMEEFKAQGARRILPVIILGAGGGTGMGIFSVVERIVERTAKEYEILGPAGMVRLVFSNLAYGYQLYDEQGQVTKNAELLKERCSDAWYNQRNSIFVMSELGADGMLAAIHAALEGKLIMNNNVSNNGFPNAVITGHDTPAWKMQRIAADSIERGADPNPSTRLWKLTGMFSKKTLVLNELPLRTIRDYAIAHRMLQKARAGAELARFLRDEGVTPANVTNYRDWENMVATVLTVVKSAADRLRRQSRANGAYTLPHEADLASLIDGADMMEILNGTYSIPRGERTLQHMVPNGVLFRKSYPLGNAIVLFEQGQLDHDDALPHLVPISFTVISREDQEAAERQAVTNKIKDGLFD